MEERKTTLLMKGAAALVALGLVVIYGLLLPMLARDLYAYAPEYRYAFGACLAYSLVSALPCVAALIAFIRMIGAIQAGRSFSAETESAAGFIARMAFAEGAYLAGGVILSGATNVGSPGLFCALIGLALVALTIGLLARALAQLIHRARVIREENDLTV